MTPSEYETLKRFLKTRSGLVLSDEKQYLVESRLIPVSKRHGLTSLSVLIQSLNKPGTDKLQNDVIEAMTTNESFFFRDKTPFDHFQNVMIPHFLEHRRSRKRVRVWCAAASTGQEPYSLAITLRELQAKLAGFRFEILGTDISTEVLEKARTGVYSQFEVQRGLPIQQLVKYFTQQGEMWQINPDMRAMIQWRKLNLLDSFNSLGEFDVVFCRNVLIYFDQETKVDILNRLAKQLPEDGYLVLGAAETVVGLIDCFEPVPGLRGLYRPKQKATGAVPGARLDAAKPMVKSAAGLTSRLGATNGSLAKPGEKPLAGRTLGTSATKPLTTPSTTKPLATPAAKPATAPAAATSTTTAKPGLKPTGTSGLSRIRAVGSGLNNYRRG